MASRPPLLERLIARWHARAGDALLPPRPGDAATMAATREGLKDFFDRATARFDACFLAGRPLRPRRDERALLERLRSLGVVTRLGPLVLPCVRLIRLDDRWIASDLLSRPSPDQVFTIMFEQVYTVRAMRIGPDEDVLELCAGSGTLSLYAADAARAVTAVDVNPRALAFVRFNLALNACARPVDLREGSLFEPLDAGQRFDRVLVNPPFEPVPPGTETFLHSDGGEDGLDVVRAVFEGAPARLTPTGRVTMVTWSPGTEAGPLLADLARDMLPTHHHRVDVLESGTLAPVLERFEGAPGYEAWRNRLASRGLTHLYFVLLDAKPSDAPGIEIRHPVDEVAACHAVADAWR